MNYGLFALIGAIALPGCGAHDAHDDPAAVTSMQPAPRPPTGSARALTGRAAASEVEALTARGEGVLRVSVRGNVPSFLGATHLVVEDTQGQVVAGADEDVLDPEAAHDSELVLTLPGAAEYTLRLSATTADTYPTTCSASVAALKLAIGATAKVQVFAWDCGDARGYVPSEQQSDCYWLANWTFLERLSAAVGERVGVKIAAQSATEDGVSYRWSSSSAELGAFERPKAAETTVRCEAAGDTLPIVVSISDGACQQQVTQSLSCF